MTYRTKGTCSMAIQVDLAPDHTIEHVEFKKLKGFAAEPNLLPARISWLRLCGWLWKRMWKNGKGGLTVFSYLILFTNSSFIVYLYV